MRLVSGVVLVNHLEAEEIYRDHQWTNRKDGRKSSCGSKSIFEVVFLPVWNCSDCLLSRRLAAVAGLGEVL